MAIHAGYQWIGLYWPYSGPVSLPHGGAVSEFAVQVLFTFLPVRKKVHLLQRNIQAKTTYYSPL